MFVPHPLLRLFSTLGLILAILIFVIGCGSSPPTATPPPTTLDANGIPQKTLTLWHTFDGDRGDALKELTDEFHRTYPDFSIQTVYVGGHDDLTKQMTAAIALGNPPDLVLADRRQIADFATQGGLQALDTFVDDAELGLSKQDRADYWRGALSLGNYPKLDNQMFGFPFDQEPMVLFYNKDLLKTINVNRAPRTWDQFAEDASTVSQGDIYGWAMDANTATFEAMLASRGSALLTDAETRTLFQERAGLYSLRLVSDMNVAGAAVLLPSDDKAQRAFASGKVAFYIGWLSDIGSLELARKDAKRSFEIGVAPLPQLDPQAPWLLTRGDLFGITRASGARARDAWFFVRWITSPTQSARWVRATDALPLRASALTFLPPAPSSKARFQQILSALDGSEPQLVPQPAHPFMGSIELAVGDVWLQATQEKPDLSAILDNLATRVNQILAIQP